MSTHKHRRRRPRGRYQWRDLQPSPEALADLLDHLNERLDPETRDLASDIEVERDGSTLILKLGIFHLHIFRLGISSSFTGNGTFTPVRPEHVVRLQYLRPRHADEARQILRDLESGKLRRLRKAQYFLLTDLPENAWDLLRDEIPIYTNDEGEYVNGEDFLQFQERLRKRGTQ